MQEVVNRRELCRRFGISPQTGYKWLDLFAGGSLAATPSQCWPQRAGERGFGGRVRDAHPAWGARKIARCLAREGHDVPAISTVHAILRRHGRVAPPAGTPGQPYRRFEKDAPNQLWQMDFKGHMPLGNGTSCHPLTMVDDHSRFALCAAACADERGSTVRTHLETTFRRYGLPEAMFVDNGGPWGFTLAEPSTRLSAWLLKLGVGVIGNIRSFV